MEPTRWFVPPSNALKWRHWESDFVVFNCASGDTHFLNDFAGAILQFLEASPASVQEVLDYVEQSAGQPSEPELITQIHGLIEKFDESGLIEPTRS